MFFLAVQNLGDEDQVAEYIPKLNNLRMMGTYAQTELGHGSNVAGIETTATFDKVAD